MKVWQLSKTAKHVFETLPAEFKKVFLDVSSNDNPDDFVQELACAWLEGKTANQARSKARRFTDGGNSIRYALSLEQDFATVDENYEFSSFSRSVEDELIDIEERLNQKESEETSFEGLDVATIAKRTGLTKEAIYYRIKIQSKKAEQNFDLFFS